MKRNFPLSFVPRCVAAAGVLAVMPGLSFAEGGSPLADASSVYGQKGPSSRGLTVATGDERPEGQWTLYGTAGIGYAPRYSGSDESSVVPIVGAGVRSPNGFFLSTDHGLGWETQALDSTFRFYVAPSASRKDHKKGFQGSDKLRGLGDIKSRAQIGMDAETMVGPVTLSATIAHAFKKGDDRDVGSAYTLFNLGASTTVYEGSAGAVSLALSGTFGDGNYMRTWYGVSNQQSVKSGYRAYNPKGGLESIGLGATWTVPMGKDWSWTMAAETRRLFGDAADSPFVKERNQFSVGTMVTYTY
ncbi:MipA/OmpV family protein [Achromobacter seleniivolatilans]|uniref:MipA/OmpV family protein n=1 Tax=Achromobacter seleniivolatilans TaxID=3047478 RepID=A0ABY9M4T8_9BURK|nr:MipA/OmpV family protein [Achromobacter sp. R39]WMD21965.1 MipA/OmpV family protein [Achromobacter sp. R39]